MRPKPIRIKTKKIRINPYDAKININIKSVLIRINPYAP